MSAKLWLGICIIIACTLIGRAMAQSAERHCRQLTRTIDAVRSLNILTTEMLEPVRRALEQTEFPPFQSVAAKMSPETSAVELWMEVAGQREERAIDCLNASERKCIEQMFRHLGNSVRSSQKELFAVCRDQLLTALSDAQLRAKEVSRLYTSLGFLTGASIVVLSI